jgi:hypothetical protein
MSNSTGGLWGEEEKSHHEAWAEKLEAFESVAGFLRRHSRMNTARVLSDTENAARKARLEYLLNFRRERAEERKAEESAAMAEFQQEQAWEESESCLDFLYK